MTVGDDCGASEGTWRDLRAAVECRVRANGAWGDSTGALADEYVAAMRRAKLLREIAEATPFTTSPETGRVFLNPGFAAADRCVRSVLSLAEALGLTGAAPAARGNPFAELEAAERPPDLAARRRKRASSQPGPLGQGKRTKRSD